MKNYGNQVRDLFMRLPRADKMFLGGPPFSEEVNAALRNYAQYAGGELPKRQRASMGTCEFSLENSVIGYTQFTLFNQANPTAYEKKFLHIDVPTDFVVLKSLFVDPEYRGKGVSDKLLFKALGVAEANERMTVADVMATNERIIHFLKKNHFYKFAEWKTPKGTLMHRMMLD